MKSSFQTTTHNGMAFIEFYVIACNRHFHGEIFLSFSLSSPTPVILLSHKSHTITGRRHPRPPQQFQLATINYDYDPPLFPKPPKRSWKKSCILFLTTFLQVSREGRRRGVIGHLHLHQRKKAVLLREKRPSEGEKSFLSSFFFILM